MKSSKIHKKIEENLLNNPKTSADLFMHILRDTQDIAIASVDPKGKIIYWNEGAKRIYGYTPDEVVGKMNCCTLHLEADVRSGKPKEYMDIALMKGKWEGVIKKRRKNGTIFTAKVIMMPRCGSEHNEPIGFLLIVKDIYEAFRTQEPPVASHNSSRSLIESIPDALLATDQHGIITDVNARICRMTGYSNEELIGKHFPGYFTDPKKAAEEVLTVFDKGEIRDCKLTLRKKNRQESLVSINAGLFKGLSNAVKGLFVFVREIPEQTQLEEKLSALQFYAHSLIDAFVDALIILDPLGRITDINQQMEVLTGYSRNELTGSSFKQHFTDPKRAEDGMNLVLKESKITNYELTICSKNGQQTVVSYNAKALYDQNQKLKGIIACVRDITDLKKNAQILKEKNIELEKANKRQKESKQVLQTLNRELEKRIHERTQELEIVNKELESFAYSISHNLRIPLRAIDGFSRLLYEKSQESLSEESQRYLSLIRKGAHDMGILIESLLSFCMSSKKPIKKEPIQTKALVEIVLQQFVTEKKGRDMEIIIGDLADCQADSHLLIQVFFNLLSNAFKFTSKKKKARIEISSFENEGRNVFYVKDNGVGFDMHYAYKLFGVFQRLHSEEEFKGTGVGLAITKRIIDRHGGFIWAESEVNKGATFCFYL